MPAFWKPFAVVLLGVLLTCSGQVLVARCIRDRSGTSPTAEIPRQWRHLREALWDRRAAAGVIFMLIAFPLGLLALAMADVSVAVPLGAMSYILATFLGKFYLGEQVGVLRWMGTIIIVIGTVLIGVSACQSDPVTSTDPT